MSNVLELLMSRRAAAASIPLDFEQAWQVLVTSLVQGCVNAKLIRSQTRFPGTRNGIVSLYSVLLGTHKKYEGKVQSQRKRWEPFDSVSVLSTASPHVYNLMCRSEHGFLVPRSCMLGNPRVFEKVIAI
jgi:hypothetical protein